MEHEDKSPTSLASPDVAGVAHARVDASATVDSVHESDAPPPAKREKQAKSAGRHPNGVRRLRIDRMMSKAELARRANVSVLTIDRVEKGYGCRMDTKRKILEALGLNLSDRVRVFGEEE